MVLVRSTLSQSTKKSSRVSCGHGGSPVQLTLSTFSTLLDTGWGHSYWHQGDLPACLHFQTQLLGPPWTPVWANLLFFKLDLLTWPPPGPHCTHPPPPLTGKQSLLCCGGCLLLLFLFTSTLSISFLSVLVTTASYSTFHCPPFISTHSLLASFSASGVLAVTRSIASFMRVRSTLLNLASHNFLESNSSHCVYNYSLGWGTVHREQPATSSKAAFSHHHVSGDMENKIIGSLVWVFDSLLHESSVVRFLFPEPTSL